MSRPKLGEKKKLTHYESAAAQRRAEMEQHFEALAAVCYSWGARHEHDDLLLADSNQGMDSKDGGEKC